MTSRGCADAKQVIAVDVRMAYHSGIGRYIRETAPRVRAVLPEYAWRWVGARPEEWMQLDQPRTEFVAWNAPIYSWREHFRTPKVLARASVRWVPHYNVTAGGGARLVVTVHDLLPLAMADGFRGWIRKRIVQRYLSRIRREAAAVVTVSQFTEAALKNATSLEAARIRMIPLGCSLRGLTEASGSAGILPAGLPPYYFVFVGNVKPHKNLLGLLNAWSDVADQVPESIVIVGSMEGFFTGDVATAKKAAELGSRVVFTGQIADSTLYRILSGATALVQPSFYEGFGLPVLEAMSVGCPVLAANAASLPEVGGDAAEYFQLNDRADFRVKLVALSSNQALRSRLQSAGLERVKQFTWERTAERTAAVLREVLEERR